MKQLAVLVWMCTGGAALASENWHPLTGDEIREALTERKLQYKVAWQEFLSSGRTLYNSGSESWGYWRVESDQYCSKWPPSDLWTCYDMARSGQNLRFIGVGGDVTDAFYAQE